MKPAEREALIKQIIADNHHLTLEEIRHASGLKSRQVNAAMEKLYNRREIEWDYLAVYSIREETE